MAIMKSVDFSFLLSFLFCLLSLSSAGCGVFTGSSGYQYYLDNLTTVNDHTIVEQGLFYNNYTFNFCKNVSYVCGNPSPSVQISTSGNCVNTGYLPPTITETTGGLIVQYVNTRDSKCGPSRSIHRTTQIVLECDPYVEYAFDNVEEPSMCVYTITGRTKYACPNKLPFTTDSTSTTGPSITGCGSFIGPSGYEYDLSGLTIQTDYIAKEPANYRYIYNFCQNINNLSPCNTPAPVSQSATDGSSVYCINTGYLPAVITESKGGVQIQYVNTKDSFCGPSKDIFRSTIIVLVCDSSVVYEFINVTEPGVCQYEITARSKFACPVDYITTGGSTTGI
jgi:hypothetical protein